MKKIKQSDSKFCKNTRIVSYGLNLDICNKYLNMKHIIYSMCFQNIYLRLGFSKCIDNFSLFLNLEKTLCACFRTIFFFTITELYILPYNPV